MKVGLNTIHGSIFGLAYGDALGYPVEFMSHAQIRSEKPTPPTIFKISDDTQMSIYLIKGYLNALKSMGNHIANIDKDVEVQNEFSRNVAEQFLAWESDPDNNRAPGNTCLTSLRRYAKSEKITGLEGTSPNSKGCGANMRAGWLGLLPHADEDLATMSILQAKITHGHPDALLSAALTTLLTRHLAKGKVAPSEEGSLIRRAIHLLDTQKFYDGEEELDPTNLRKMFTDALIVFPEFVYSFPKEDICPFFGEGWVADEALVLAVAATDALGGSEEPTDGIKRLAYSGGDSDSIAAIGGGMIGAYRGYEDLRRSTGHVQFEPRYKEELDWVRTKIGAVNANYRG